MNKNHIIPAALTTVLASASVLATSGSTSAGFEPTIPGLHKPVIDQPVVTPVCEDVKSPKYGWCLPDITTQFDNVSPSFRSDGSAFEEGDDIGVEIEANFHADAEEYDVLGLGDYRIDERRYGNNTDAYRYSFG